MPGKLGSSPLDCTNHNTQNTALLQSDAARYVGIQSDLSIPFCNNNSKSSSNPVTGNAQIGCNNSGASNNGLNSGWVQQVNAFVSQYSLDASGYGGSVTASGYGGSVTSSGYGGSVTPTCHANQGIGNGMEGADPGRSQPHGGSNDETGRTPGEKWIPKLLSKIGL
ncbi:MAG: hypothetical protein KME16_20110 [Scytolyngbya sp. HA4215-MV1]|jgi:hypothetical protein|nr:hypothetical protein [Scytolyngbya sp. HA4215-MV1]